MGRLLWAKGDLRICLAPAFALIAAATLNLGIIHSWSFYSPWAFAAAMAALVFGVAACIAQVRLKTESSSSRLIGLALVTAAMSCWLAYVAYNKAQVYYLDDSTFAHYMANANYWGAITIGVLIVVSVIADWIGWRRWRMNRHIVLLATMLAFAFAVRYFAIRATPDPVIDVFNLLRDDADHIIEGKNPYTTDIESPYGTPRAAQFGLTDPAEPRPAGYPPLPLLLSVPPRLFHEDVRWSNVVGDLVAASAIALAGFRRNRPLHGLLVTAIFLNLPRMPWIIEEAWYEPMIAALFGMGLVLTEFGGRTKWLGYVSIGLGLTAKQFGLPLLLPFAWAHRRNWRIILLGLVVGVLVILPWFIWSPRDFMEIVVWKHLARPLQLQSITVGSFLADQFDIGMPRIVGWVFAVASLIAIGAVTPKRGAATALGIGSALMAFCVFHTQGFPNYFYLVQYLWLLGYVGALPPKQSESKLTSGDSHNVPIRSIA